MGLDTSVGTLSCLDHLFWASRTSQSSKRNTNGLLLIWGVFGLERTLEHQKKIKSFIGHCSARLKHSHTGPPKKNTTMGLLVRNCEGCDKISCIGSWLRGLPSFPRSHQQPPPRHRAPYPRPLWPSDNPMKAN